MRRISLSERNLYWKAMIRDIIYVIIKGKVEYCHVKIDRNFRGRIGLAVYLNGDFATMVFIEDFNVIWSFSYESLSKKLEKEKCHEKAN